MTGITQGYWEFSADGNGAAIDNSATGGLQFVAQGDFGGGTAKLQFSVDNGTTWQDVSGASFSANGVTSNKILASQGEKLRAVLSGSSNPDLKCCLLKVEG